MLVKREKGFILLIMLLFLIVLSVVAFSVLDTNVLETKAASLYQDKIRSFYLAEKKLREAENSLMLGIRPKDVVIEPIKSEYCSANFSRIIAEGKYKGVKTVLQSVVAVPSYKEGCEPEVKIRYGRQTFFWR